MEYRPYYLAKEWVKQGHNVKIIAASESHLRQKRPLTHKQKITHEDIEGISYTWLNTPSYNGNGLKRVLNMLSFGYSLYTNAKKLTQDFIPDAIIASSPHPFIIRGSNRIAQLHNAKLIFEVRDLWPLSLIELGNISPLHPFISIMKHEEKFAYQKSDKIVSLLSNAADYMHQHGMQKDKFAYIPNGVTITDTPKKPALPKQLQENIDTIKKEYKLLLCFAGSHGIANALSYLLDAASKLIEEPIAFILIGSGTEKSALKQKAQTLNLKNVFFFDPIDKANITQFLKQMDILYIGLQKKKIFEYGVSPNKLFDYMLATKPIIHAIEAGNDIVTKSHCGISCKAENADSIAKAILKIKESTLSERNNMGEQGHKYVIKHHSYRVLAKKYLHVMKR